MSTFSKSFNIGPKAVGTGAPVLFIAEAGVSHFADPDKADALVDLAADAKADVFKTQAFITEEMISSADPYWRDRMRVKEVDFKFLRRMKDRCEKRGLIFMCTAHDEEALRWVDDLDVPAYKVGSGERGNMAFLRKIAERKKPIIWSTGMHRAEDIELVLSTADDAGCRELALLHCVTSYPTPYAQSNLRGMEALRALFPGPVGYSDHTEGIHVPLAAVALGASIIEKHITLEYDIPNAQDWKVAAGPDNLADLVRQVRDIEAALGQPSLEIQPCEQEALTWALKSLVTAGELSEGTELTAALVKAKRPGGGIEPSELERVIGRKLRRALPADHQISWDDLTP